MPCNCGKGKVTVTLKSGRTVTVSKAEAQTLVARGAATR